MRTCIRRIRPRKKTSKKHDKVVKEAYSFLVEYAKHHVTDEEYAEKIRDTARELWCECINEEAPWTN